VKQTYQSLQRVLNKLREVNEQSKKAAAAGAEASSQEAKHLQSSGHFRGVGEQ